MGTLKTYATISIKQQKSGKHLGKSNLPKKERGVHQGHVECPKCGSNDNGSVYLHLDGSHSFYCWGGGCGHAMPEVDLNTMEFVPYKGKRVRDPEEEQERLEAVRDELAAMPWPKRMMKEDVYDLYGVRMGLDKAGEDITAVYYPTYRDGEHVGYRNRLKFEAWMDQVKKKPHLDGVLKNFNGGIGDTLIGIEMFGQHLFPPGGKRIIVTCGEEDAIAAYHMTSLKTKFDGGYPCVSVPSGENVAHVQPNLRYLSSFEEIFIVSDQDKAGKAFQDKLCRLLPVGKVKLVSLPKGVKDPSEMWTNPKTKQGRRNAAGNFYNALWQAEKYSPAGVMSLSEGWTQYKNRGKDILIPFPDAFGDLNVKTYGGYALGEIVNVIAPSSVGKSSFVKEMIYTGLTETNYNIGVISLEETVDEFIEGFLSIHMSEQLNEIPYDERDNKKEWEAFQDLLSIRPEGEEENSVERIQFLDHQGACTGEQLLEKIDFLINGLDCKIIIVDPVTLAFSGSDTDEDDMASEIVKRVKRHKLAWINVHHVRKSSTGSKANSEGADLAEEDIKGTGAWFQVASINLIFTRNKVHDNATVRNTTAIKMSKCRRHGKSTGKAGWIFYDGDTGRLLLGQDPTDLIEAQNEFEGDGDNKGDGW